MMPDAAMIRLSAAAKERRFLSRDEEQRFDHPPSADNHRAAAACAYGGVARKEQACPWR